MARILVIDDDEQIRETLRIVLTRDKHEVTVAADGFEGAKRYKESPFDLVITDIIMPDKEGLETLVEFLNTENPPKIIVISGGGKISAERYLEIAKMLGAHSVLTKPIKRNILRGEIERLLGTNS